jgi:hypothetical protein
MAMDADNLLKLKAAEPPAQPAASRAAVNRAAARGEHNLLNDEHNTDDPPYAFAGALLSRRLRACAAPAPAPRPYRPLRRRPLAHSRPARGDACRHDLAHVAAWLEGCWRGAVNQREFREHWLPLRGA